MRCMNWLLISSIEVTAGQQPCAAPHQPADTPEYPALDHGSPLDVPSLNNKSEQNDESDSDTITVQVKPTTNLLKRGSKTKRPAPPIHPPGDPLLDLIDFDPACIYWRTPTFQETSLFSNSPTVLSDRQKWHLTNDVYKQGLESYKRWSRDYGSDFSWKPFIAILKGWEGLDEKEQSNPVHETLKWVDQRVFGTWHSKAQRIALMLIKQRLMTVSVNQIYAVSFDC